MRKRDLLLRFSALSDAIAAAPNDEALLAELGVLGQRMDEEEACERVAASARIAKTGHQ